MNLEEFVIDFHPDVELDYYNAYSWYEQQQEGLGDRFLLRVREKLNIIKRSPEVFGVKSRLGYREATINEFPYLIVYKVYKKMNRVFVISIPHEKMSARNKYRK